MARFSVRNRDTTARGARGFYGKGDFVSIYPDGTSFVDLGYPSKGFWIIDVPGLDHEDPRVVQFFINGTMGLRHISRQRFLDVALLSRRQVNTLDSVGVLGFSTLADLVASTGTR